MLGLGSYLGQDTLLVTPDEARAIYPLLDASHGLLGGMFSPTDGSIDPTGLTNAFAKGAKRRGARIVEDCPVEELVIKEGKVQGVRTKDGEVHYDL